MRIHPDDYATVMKHGVAGMKHVFMRKDNLNVRQYKLIREYRALVHGSYRRITEEMQVLETDRRGNVWLVLSIVNLSPNQSMPFKAASQLIDTRTGDAFSFINLQGDEDLFIAREMVNGGKGLNYGVDITFEQFMTRGFYYMVTASLFDSRYRTDTGEWYNTRFNRNFAVNLLAGKE